MSLEDMSNPALSALGKTYELRCAHCGSSYTHQIRVATFARNEDAETGIYNAVDFQNLTFTQGTSMEGNPSSRRDGISVVFNCEECDGLTGMDIVQHKGTTYVYVSDV